MNVYPYFSAENEDLPTQWAKMLKRYPQHAHKIRLTETGWPSDGEMRQPINGRAWVVAPFHLYITRRRRRTRDGPPAHYRSLSTTILIPAHSFATPHPTSTTHSPAKPGSPNFAGQTATFEQGKWYYKYYLNWACEQASQGAPAAETFYYAYFDGRAPLKAPDYEQ